MSPRPRRPEARRRMFSTFLWVVASSVALGALALLRPGTDLVQAASPRLPLPPPRTLPAFERSPDGRSGTFSLLTLDVAALPDLLNAGATSRRMPPIAARLTAYDLVLLQGDHAHHEVLDRDFAHRYQSVSQVSARRPLNDGLNRLSRFPFVPVERTAWPTCHGVWDDGHDCLEDLGFSVAETTLTPAAQVLVYNVATDAGGAARDAEARAAQLRSLEHALRETEGQAVIVAGTTHLSPRSSADTATLTRFLADTGLSDICDASCPRSAVGRVFYRSGDGLTLEPLLHEEAPEFGRGDSRLTDVPPLHARFQFRVEARRSASPR